MSIKKKSLENKNNIMFLFLGVLLFLSILTAIFLSSLVSAQSFTDNLLQGAGNALSFLVGPIETTELLLIKFLVFLLLLAIINSSLNKVPAFSNAGKWLTTIVSLIISFMAIRFLTTDAWINFIWLPYGALGILLTSFLPFVIFFYFIMDFDDEYIRTVGWSAFIAIYIGLAAYRWNDLALNPASVSGYSFNLGWIYIAIAAVSLLVILFEKSIRSRIFLSRIRKSGLGHLALLSSDLKSELARIDKALANPHINKREEDNLKKEKQNVNNALRRLGEY